MSDDEYVVERVKLERCAGYVSVNHARMWLQRGVNLATYLSMFRSANRADTRDISVGKALAGRRLPSFERRAQGKEDCEQLHNFSRKLP
jgi:hypothetical protein